MAPLTPAPHHVPAWKRLGLKLKNANEEPAAKPDSYPMHVREESKKRKAVNEVIGNGQETGAPPKKVKRPKKAHSISASTSPNGSEYHNDNPLLAQATGTQIPLADPQSSSTSEKPVITKRKSVTFAREAKSADGDSTKDLYDRWLATQKTADASFDPRTAAAALKVVPPTPTSKPSVTPQLVVEGVTGKKKRKAKSRSTTIKAGKNLISSPQDKISSARGDDARPHPALSYLTEYHNSPSTWKFSKNNQKHLLKNLFSLEKLPGSYDAALQAYLIGLKGISARQSTRKAALDVREEDEMWLSDILANGRRPEWEAKRRREAYEAAWKREKDRLEDIEDLREWEEGKGEFELRLKKRRRAEKVLGAVGEVENQVPVAAVSESAAGGTGITNTRVEVASVEGGNGRVQFTQNAVPKQTGRKKRKRKRRTTGVPDDDSSTSSSSSDSDTESEGDNNLLKSLIKEKQTANSTPSSGLGGSATEEEAIKIGSEGSESSSEETDGDSEEDGSNSESSSEDESDGTND